MKKHIRFLAAALLVLSLSACTNVEKSEVPENNPAQMANSDVLELEQRDVDEKVASSEKAFSSESKKAVVSSKAPAAPTVSPNPTLKPAEKSKKAQQDSPAARSTEPPNQSSTEPPKVQEKVQATVPPASSTPAPTPVPTPEPPAPTPAPPEPTPEPVVEEPAFDIGYWVGYAQSYAAGVGLTLESSAVDCWDNPIPAGAHCTNIGGDIQSRLNRYANDPDVTDVWIWYESAGGGSYNIYIGYA